MKILKLYAAIGSIILMGNNVMAQKCKFEINKMDAISGKEIKATKPVFCDKDQYNELRFVKEGDLFYIYNKFFCTNERREIVKKGQEFVLKLVSGELITFSALEETRGGDHIVNSAASGASLFTKWDVKCIITKEQLTKLSNSAAIAISTLPFSKYQGNSLEIKEKKGKEIAESAACILQ